MEVDEDSGRFVPRSQIQDYQCRGSELADYSFLSFLVDTYEIPVNERPVAAARQEGGRGRPRNERSRYTEGHPKHKTRQRIVRTQPHRTLPNFVGKWFAKRHAEAENGANDLFFCSMLALLKPWRGSLEGLKTATQTWEEAYTLFMSTAPKKYHDIVSSIQFYHHCNEAATHSKEHHEAGGSRGSRAHVVDDDEPLGEDVSAGTIRVTEAEYEALLRSQNPQTMRDDAFSRTAISIAKSVGIFSSETDLTTNTATLQSTNHDNSSDPMRCLPPGISIAEGGDLARLRNWRAALKESLLDEAQESLGEGSPSEDTGGVILQNDEEQVSAQGKGERGVDAPGVDLLPSDAMVEDEDVGSDLLEEQRRAFDIVKWHLEDALEGKDPSQLLMQIQGEPGTGKSRVIKAITTLFKQKGHTMALLRAAPTGIAACLIDGRTLHSVTMTSGIRLTTPSQKKLQKLAIFWKPILYLIIDEISMVPREMLAWVSRVISMAKEAAGCETGDRPFGGISVIIVGDFHQFAPVSAKPLYHPPDPSKAERKEGAIGHNLYKDFGTVVILKQQHRVTDPQWVDFLQHARHGQCEPRHLTYLRSLVMTSPNCNVPDFNEAPWNRAVLITSRHSVRVAWNDAATKKHCRDSHTTLFHCKAQDRVDGRVDTRLTIEERCGILEKSRGSGRNGCGGLPDTVAVPLGLEVMVTYNVETEVDVANGARATIVGIVLDEAEPPFDGKAAEVTLQYPPAYILVRMHRTKAPRLEGLEEGVIPLEPMERKFEISLPGGQGRRWVHRRQLPLTAAYAFTDYRGQGQTLETVVVDIGPVPTGKLTPFNAYVALSRAAGADRIRLLRDFDDELFTTVPSPELELEDRRLKILDEKTKREWEEQKFRRKVMVALG